MSRIGKSIDEWLPRAGGAGKQCGMTDNGCRFGGNENILELVIVVTQS